MRDFALLFNGNAVTVFDITNENYDLHWNYLYNADQNTISFTLNSGEHDLELTVPANNVSFVRNFDTTKFNIFSFISRVYGDVEILTSLDKEFTNVGHKTRIKQKHGI